MAVVLKNEGVAVKQMFILISSENVTAKIGHLQAILEEYTNRDGLHINYI